MSSFPKPLKFFPIIVLNFKQMSSVGTKRKKTHLPSDFKRRKAKVGKRAPQPLNLTDTSFKAVSVQVKNQSLDVSKSVHAIQSTRGKSIADLTHQMYHPASAVRTSAMRGIINIIQTTPLDILEMHLSVLLPVIAQSASVDDDKNVRSLGITAFRTLISIDKEKRVVWKPFIPLLRAFITSALNSLDRLTRLDGSRIVDIISSLPIDGNTVSAILPAYVTLLQDHSRAVHSSALKPGTKSLKGSDESNRFIVVQSMMSLLKSINVEKENNLDADAEEPSLTLGLRNSATISLVLLVSKERQSVRPVRSLEALIDFHQSAGKQELEFNAQSKVKESIVIDLFTKLRDIFVDVSQRGTLGASGLTLGSSDMEEMSMLISTIHLLWKFSFQGQQSPVVSHLLTMMMEAIPIRSRSGENLHRYEGVNGHLCMAVIEMGCDLSKQKERTDTVVEFLLSKLDKDSSNESGIAIKVLGRLCAMKSMEGTPLLDKAMVELILKRISDTYFSSKDLDPDVIRSLGGREAMKMVISHLRESNFNLTNPSLQEIFGRFPLYIVSWGIDYLNESNDVLEMMIRVVRQIETNEHSSAFPIQLAEGLMKLFTVENGQNSIFEQYSPTMQRKLICLLASLGSPSQDLLHAFARVVAGAGVGLTHDLADFILDVINHKRNKIDLETYVDFVLSCIGLPETCIPEDNFSWILAKDNAAVRTSRALRNCGISNILPILLPRLKTWLKDPKIESFLHFRVALLIISIFSQVEQIFNVVPELSTVMVASVISFLSLCLWDNEKPELFRMFEQPLTVRPNVITLYFQESTNFDGITLLL
jgi:hypothetical protein